MAGYNPHQGLRQQAFLASIGIGMDVPVTGLSDGGEDIRHACQLPAAAERALDWFHIGMRFEHLLTFLRGFRGAAADERAQLERRAEGAKWFLWHGKQKSCLQRLESLRRATGWVGTKNPLGRLIRHLTGSADLLINYKRRPPRAQGRSISSAGAESAVDYVIGQRMKRNGHMRWMCATSSDGIHPIDGSIANMSPPSISSSMPPGNGYSQITAVALQSNASRSVDIIARLQCPAVRYDVAYPSCRLVIRTSVEGGISETPCCQPVHLRVAGCTFIAM